VLENLKTQSLFIQVKFTSGTDVLVAQPWPERLADPGMRAVRLLGRMFDLPGMYHRPTAASADASACNSDVAIVGTGHR
jgi:hypothetical protein